MPYAELHCISNFTFLRGASHPEELVARAKLLNYRALAITDECSLAGIVRAHRAAREWRIKLIIGSEFKLIEGLHCIVIAPDKLAYHQLCNLISRARKHSPKGNYQLTINDLCKGLSACLLLWRPQGAEEIDRYAQQLQENFAKRLWITLGRTFLADEYRLFHIIAQASARHGIPMVASGNVHMHCQSRKALMDVLWAIRLNSDVQTLGVTLAPHAEAYLRKLDTLREELPAALLQASIEIAERCQFSLDELKYQYPDELAPPGVNACDWLAKLTWEGAKQRWPEEIPSTVSELINKELSIIKELQYEHYFLTVHDIVMFARSQNILCQGRGSAANSAVCYCLHITEVDPARSSLLFERFISKERDEPPDIDVDFEHQRREEVIQYIYRKYGRQRAALAATVISYRPRSAIRDVGKALGFAEHNLKQLSKSLAWWDKLPALENSMAQAGIQASTTLSQHFIELVKLIQGFPRHLSQHVGGFVITRDPITSLIPVENASMAGRTIIQWDKDDLESLCFMKMDVLALGMLSAIRRSLDIIGTLRNKPFKLSDIPADDEATYAMLSRGDAVGVFQVESRAQMNMLPRLQPRCFYDLVIQIAIIRPGPIQGGMVHPYLRRRQGLEAINYDNEAIEGVLKRTLGVPIFQEQVIQLAMVAAGFTGGEADQLRRAMASWGKNGHLDDFRGKLINGMRERGHSEAFAERLFNQMRGFGAYGFPESHSASFALLAYASAWIKRHYPAAFFCGLLNSQPMGFYAPSQLIQDAKRHAVQVNPICVNHSHWHHHVDESGNLQLGLCLVKGLQAECAQHITDARRAGPFTSIRDLLLRCSLDRGQRDSLARADALHSLATHRHQSQWLVNSLPSYRPLLAASDRVDDDADINLPAPSEVDDIKSDYQHTQVSLRRHPMAILRKIAPFDRCYRSQELPQCRDGQFIRIAGMVTCRQRPGSAAGVLFITLEDETGHSNIVVWKPVQERRKREILREKILLVKGVIQRTENPSNTPVIHVVAIDIEAPSEPHFNFLQGRSRYG